MRPTLVPLKLPPGMARNGTDYQNAGRWINGNLVRWREGAMQPVGGWAPAGIRAPAPPLPWGTARRMFAWAGFEGVANDFVWTAVGALDALIAVNNTGEQFLVRNVPAGPRHTTYAGTGGLDTREVPAMTWHLDNFGDVLLAVATHVGTLYAWYSSTPAVAAFPVANAPTNNTGVVVTPERFVVALGAGGNSRRVQWASRETLTTWAPAATNTAGFLDLNANGSIVCGRRLRDFTLIWTTTDLHQLNFIGGTFVYGLQQVGANCGVIGPSAVALVNDTAYWMGEDGFFLYDGFVKPLPCDVSDYVFNRLVRAQRVKAWAMPFAAFNEVWWFYPSTDDPAGECDSYVAYNYAEGYWTTGTLRRTAGVDRGLFPYPLLMDQQERLLEHERGFDYTEQYPAPGGGTVTETLVPFAESGPVELGDGDRFVSVTQLVPDEKLLGQVRLSLTAQTEPTAAPYSTGPLVVRGPTDVRITGRSVRVRVTQLAAAPWRVGVLRLRVVPRGRR